VDLPERWFDDYSVGEVFEVPEERLVTEERIVEFAREFDPQPFHIDPDAAASSINGGLIASGWHTGSILMSLLATTLGPASLGSPGGSGSGGDQRAHEPLRTPDQVAARQGRAGSPCRL